MAEDTHDLSSKKQLLLINVFYSVICPVLENYEAVRCLGKTHTSLKLLNCA